MTWTIDTVEPTYSCNGALIKHYRERRGWTQEAFGVKSGYSRRLVSKAEAGKSISSDTVAHLAETLSSDAERVHPEDLICDPVEFARKYVAAMYVGQRNALEHMRSFLDDEVVFEIPGDPEHVPFAGTYHGADGVAEMVERFFGVLEVPADHDHEKHYHFVGSGNEVIIWGQSWIHPIGQPLETPVEVTVRLVFRRGKLILLQDRYDQKAGVDALMQAKQVDRS